VIGRFGLRDGLSLARELARKTPSLGSLTVCLSGLDRRVTLRRGTSDSMVLWQVWGDREYAIPSDPHRDELRRRYEAALAAGKRPVILDCGANIGMASLWFAQQYPRARIVALEPEAANFAVLGANLAALPDVQLVQAALWPVQTRLRIANAGAAEWAFRVEPASEDDTAAIPAVTIDDLAPDRPDETLLVVKIDIEGAEAALFERNTQWVDRAEMIVIELHDWMFPGSGTSRNVLRRLAELDCDVLVAGQSLFAFRHRTSDGEAGGGRSRD
jgi:FkbM family methyltransferase